MAFPVVRANIGCGSIQPQGWWNFDVDSESVGGFHWDVRKPISGAHFDDFFDYAVSSFSLNELTHHELPVALRNIRQILKPGGVLRILVPNLLSAIDAWEDGDEDWFPQDDRTGGLAAKFCTFVTWFGTVRSVFTPTYLIEIVREAFESEAYECVFGVSALTAPDSGITDLDSREKEALIMEVMK
jgi:predicted SAM-dependent methyltransferase